MQKCISFSQGWQLTRIKKIWGKLWDEHYNMKFKSQMWDINSDYEIKVAVVIYSHFMGYEVIMTSYKVNYEDKITITF